MPELAYPVGHPKHPDFKGKLEETHTPFGFDYPDNHPARAGQGQPVPLVPVTDGEPHAGFRHLFGLKGNTLAECQATFDKLDAERRAERAKWNKDGIPADVLEGS